MGHMPWWAWAMLTGASLALAVRVSLHIATEVGTVNVGRQTQTHHLPSFDSDLFRQDTPLPDEQPRPELPAKPVSSPASETRRGNLLQSSWHASDAEALASCGKLSAMLVAQREKHADREPVVWRCGCKVSGLGDRLKGIIAAWMLAMVLERPFACEAFPSIQLHEYGIEPVGPDWREAHAKYVQDMAGPNRKRPLFRNRAELMMLSAENSDFSRPIEIVQTTPPKVKLVQAFIRKMGLDLDEAILSTEPFVGDGKNFTNDDAPLVSHKWRAIYAHATYCATRSLLRPTKPMLGLLDGTLAAAHSAVGGTPNPFVLGVHIRFGGKWKDRKRARDGDALRIIECAWNMTRRRATTAVDGGAPGAIWTLASDDVERLRALVTGFTMDGGERERWAARRITLATADGGIVEHVSKSVNGTTANAVRRLWHDWFLMSEAHSCALVRSSFPRTACYTSARRVSTGGLVQQMVTTLDLGRYTRTVPACDEWALAQLAKSF